MVGRPSCYPWVAGWSYSMLYSQPSQLTSYPYSLPHNKPEKGSIEFNEGFYVEVWRIRVSTII